MRAPLIWQIIGEKTLDQFTYGSKKTKLNPNTETKPYAAMICQQEVRQ